MQILGAKKVDPLFTFKSIAEETILRVDGVHRGVFSSSYFYTMCRILSMYKEGHFGCSWMVRSVCVDVEYIISKTHEHMFPGATKESFVSEVSEVFWKFSDSDIANSSSDRYKKAKVFLQKVSELCDERMEKRKHRFATTTTKK